MNSVSSAVGSKVFTTSLLRSSIRLAAVKPEPVSSLKRLSASATAPGSAESNWCLVSPVWSITICVAILASRLLKRFRTGGPGLNGGGGCQDRDLLLGKSLDQCERALFVPIPHSMRSTAAVRPLTPFWGPARLSPYNPVGQAKYLA